VPSRVAILQSNYLPWKGYFDIIHDVDTFVFYDDVQYTNRDWRNRNIIKTPQGPLWLTVPVSAGRDRLICEVSIAGRGWAQQHWRSLQHHYGRAPHFGRYKSFLEDVYLGHTWERLSELNRHLIEGISTQFLGITTEFRDSREFGAAGAKSDRIVDLLKRIGAGSYLSGPAARAYISQESFDQAGIQLEWKSYEGYPEYLQPYPPFSHQVSILDLLFQVGPDAPHYIWGWRPS
jgi:hypothetical protein